MKSASVPKTRLWDKGNHGLGLPLFKIDDPRGRLFVRAKSQTCNNEGAI